MALDLETIRTAAQRVAASHGLDVVEVDYRAGGKPRALCVYIEKNAEERAKLASNAGIGTQGLAAEQVSGVTHDDCTAFSRDFGTLLDVEDLIPGAEYTLEVSSPGLDRKLRTHAEFERFRGNLVKLQTFEPVAGNRHWQGRLTQVNAGAVTLDLSAVRQKGKSKKAARAGRESADREEMEIALANVEKASLIPEF
ncbi:MAG TPA: ribosome maturation factor RimP [Acidobacteriaceae bacterium]|nr:ribosome maturation factor RimP [Acidobacteriaceae bacterium]